MFVPLIYQMTGFDCGPTSVINALRRLYPTEELPPDFPKMVWSICLNEYNEKGAPYHNGTNNHAMRFLAESLNQYAELTGYAISCRFIEKKEVTLEEDSEILQCLREGGVAVVRIVLKGGHYVLLTGIEGNKIRMFDPYMIEPYEVNGLEWIEGHPYEYNRLVTIEHLKQYGKEPFMMSEEEKRNCILFRKTGKGTVMNK